MKRHPVKCVGRECAARTKDAEPLAMMVEMMERDEMRVYGCEWTDDKDSVGRDVIKLGKLNNEHIIQNHSAQEKIERDGGKPCMSHINMV